MKENGTYINKEQHHRWLREVLISCKSALSSSKIKFKKWQLMDILKRAYRKQTAYSALDLLPCQLPSFQHVSSPAVENTHQMDSVVLAWWTRAQKLRNAQNCARLLLTLPSEFVKRLSREMLLLPGHFWLLPSFTNAVYKFYWIFEVLFGIVFMEIVLN